jgi:hypothetical protein
MAKQRSKAAVHPPKPRAFGLVVVVAILALGALVFTLNRQPPSSPATTSPTNAPAAPLPSLEVNQAMMVTVELDFGGPPPTIAEALNSIERRHQPDAGGGRVFAILDAYGEPTPDGRKLHMSMHVSTEKPGVGSLVFKRTGEILWSSRIVASTNAPSSFSGGALTILFDNGTGKTFTVDGSKSPATILDAGIKEVGQPVRDLWQEGAEHEMTFIYSACGCPVKVMCRRVGERTVRTKDMPVIFPDDPAVVSVITRLMGW